MSRYGEATRHGSHLPYMGRQTISGNDIYSHGVL